MDKIQQLEALRKERVELIAERMKALMTIKDIDDKLQENLEEIQALCDHEFDRALYVKGRCRLCDMIQS